MERKIKVYSTATCPYCVMLKKFLEEHNIPFESVDVGMDRAGLEEMMKKSGQMGVPVIDIDGKVIVGFDREAISEALGLQNA